MQVLVVMPILVPTQLPVLSTDSEDINAVITLVNNHISISTSNNELLFIDKT